MTRRRSILLNVLTGACVVGMLAVALLWVRSLGRGDVFTYLCAAGERYTLRSVPGGIEFGYAEHLPELVATYDPVPAGWSLRQVVWEAEVTFKPPTADVHLHDAYVTVRYHYEPPGHALAGFGWEDLTVTYPLLQRPALYGMTAPGPPPVAYRTRRLVLPDAFFIVLLGALPAGRLIRRRRLARRIAAGRCVACGYDLRASSGRCPECGRAERFQ